MRFESRWKPLRVSWLTLGLIFMTGNLLGLPRRAAAATTGDHASPTPGATLTLRVYNYAHINRGLLSRSEQVATAIFESVGVQIVWLDCPLSQEQFRAYPACQSDLGTADLVLNILSRQMAMKLSILDEPLGFARPCMETVPACELTVLYYRVDEVAADGYRADRILGFVIAHEMTHVLIGSGHSREGIMRGGWSTDDLQRISWGLPLHFTTDESRELRSAIVRRRKPE